MKKVTTVTQDTITNNQTGIYSRNLNTTSIEDVNAARVSVIQRLESLSSDLNKGLKMKTTFAVFESGIDRELSARR